MGDCDRDPGSEGQSTSKFMSNINDSLFLRHCFGVVYYAVDKYNMGRQIKKANILTNVEYIMMRQVKSNRSRLMSWQDGTSKELTGETL